MTYCVWQLRTWWHWWWQLQDDDDFLTMPMPIAWQRWSSSPSQVIHSYMYNMHMDSHLPRYIKVWKQCRCIQIIANYVWAWTVYNRHMQCTQTQTLALVTESQSWTGSCLRLIATEIKLYIQSASRTASWKWPMPGRLNHCIKVVPASPAYASLCTTLAH